MLNIGIKSGEPLKISKTISGSFLSLDLLNLAEKVFSISQETVPLRIVIMEFPCRFIMAIKHLGEFNHYLP
jgi:hypothetical protein